MPDVRAEILSIGTELLLGQIVDTNAAYLARRLAGLGVDCFHISQVGDNLQRASSAIELALSRCDLLVSTGGLGPTEDDLTREAIAAVLGEEPSVDAVLEGELQAWFARRGLAMPDRNRKQAWLIPSARAIANPHGTAPGWWVRARGKEIVAMPGVPREMTQMWEGHVETELASRSGAQFVARTLKVLGLGESAVEERLAELTRSTFPTVATYAKSDGVHVRIAAKGARAEAADAVARVERVARERLGEHVWGADDDSLVALIGAELEARGWRLAVRETLSAGAVCAALCESGAPPWFAGGVVGEGSATPADVRLEVDAGDQVVRVRARTPDATRELEARFDTVPEGRRRAVLIALDALRRVLDS